MPDNLTIQMTPQNKTVTHIIKRFSQNYLIMDLGVIKINCPYWMNKIKDGKVVIRGQFNGKGSSSQIQQALTKALKHAKNQGKISKDFVLKLAKRERLGIDCSGFVYRILDNLLSSLGKNLDQIFPEGVNKTNARTLTSLKYNCLIKKTQDIKPADLIRLMGGKHVTLVINNDGQYIDYIHSSNRLTIEKGVHTARIKIIAPQKNLDKQMWLEKTPSQDNFGKKYFHLSKGDGARRLKIFKDYES